MTDEGYVDEWIAHGYVHFLEGRVRDLYSDRERLRRLIAAYASHVARHEGVDFLRDYDETDELQGKDWDDVRAIVRAFTEAVALRAALQRTEEP